MPKSRWSSHKGMAVRQRIFMGIDPGKSGGIACVRGSDVWACQMPKTERDVWEFIDDNSNVEMTVIEKVWAMPSEGRKQGVTSMFTFGMGYGGLRMALIAAGRPFKEVTSRSWQKHLGIAPRKKTESKTQWKHRLKAMAQQLYPGEDVTLATADALLIANYCQQMYGGMV